uniref:Thyroglobulin type-1 domain-containing protein n=1 Tax=Oreochromis aureus TaxID=47969 RepID=A0A668UD94_OREAU
SSCLRCTTRPSPAFAPVTPSLKPTSTESSAMEANSVFIPCTPSGAFQEVQCQGAECWCVDPQGQEMKGSRTVARRPRCPSPCERARGAALEVRSNMAAGAEIHIPACSQDGDFLPLQCVGSRCFCVDAEEKMMTAGPAGGAVTCVG